MDQSCQNFARRIQITLRSLVVCFGLYNPYPRGNSFPNTNLDGLFILVIVKDREVLMKYKSTHYLNFSVG